MLLIVAEIHYKKTGEFMSGCAHPGKRAIVRAYKIFNANLMVERPGLI
jgi:hypothetical protein